mgnify:CR=1 FL=1
MIKIGKLNISKRNLIIISTVILIVIGGILLLTKDNDKGLFYNPDKNIKIVKSEASKIELIFIIQLKYIIQINHFINFSSI